ncbi:unnamed protein product [Toxocara canis]|uniref:ACB domain-containing protein n=1 Tax=Toxocara canis TaxID=6265 RepID=A0A183U0X4_TOXCA|nr:unnamed protein product [Toxocara canis]
MARHLVQEFEEAAEQVKKLKSRPPDDIFLKCYSLYKQATVGDINITKPKSNDFKEKAKFEAWGKMKGTTLE